jgi:hypothetical protein
LEHETKVRVPKEEPDGQEHVLIDTAETSEDEEQDNTILQAQACIEGAVAEVCSSKVLQERNC